MVKYQLKSNHNHFFHVKPVTTNNFTSRHTKQTAHFPARRPWHPSTSTVDYGTVLFPAFSQWQKTWSLVPDHLYYETQEPFISLWNWIHTQCSPARWRGFHFIYHLTGTHAPTLIPNYGACSHWVSGTVLIIYLTPGAPGQLAVLTALSPRENKQELQWVTELWQIHNFKWGLSGPTHLTMPYNALPYEVNNHGAPGQSGPELCVGGINKKQVCNLEVETDK